MKICAVSDLHQYQVALPDADVLVFGGDACSRGSYLEFAKFSTWLKEVSTRYKHVVLIAGNHDRVLEQMSPAHIQEEFFAGTNITYLQDAGITLDGIKFWGSPYTPAFCDWGFQLYGRESARQKWESIPDDVNVLVTHGPPRGILDYVPRDNKHAGCPELFDRVVEIEPKIHIFGHLHFNGGQSAVFGNTRFYNVAVCDEEYKPINKIHIIECSYGPKK
jgi:Icc-related predicted phosphoesterase